MSDPQTLFNQLLDHYKTSIKDYDEAFQILQQLDLSSLNYIEGRSMLQIAQQKKAWDFEIIIFFQFFR